MAIINKLRNSRWVLFFILFSLIIFIGTSVITSANSRGNGNSDLIGEVNGEKLKFSEFDNELKNRIANAEAQGFKVDEGTREELRKDAWNKYIDRVTLEKQFEKAGVKIGIKELQDMVYSDNPDPTLRERFTDPETQAFDPKVVREFLKTRYQTDKVLHQQFDELKNYIKLEAVNKKYFAILKNGIYSTKLDVENDFSSQAESVKGKIVSLDYSSIKDADVKVTEEEMQAYLNDHKEDFQQKEETRDIEFVTWSISPSAEDSAVGKNWAYTEYPNFKTTSNDTIFVGQYGTVPFDTAYKPRGTIDNAIETALFRTPKDSLLGPVYYDGGYSIFKVKGIKQDSAYYMRASQITIPMKAGDSLGAIADGKKLIAEAKAMNDFAKFAESKSSLGYYANNGTGDLGWWKDGQQIKQVNDAVKKANKGDYLIVKAPTGIQLIYVSEEKTKTLVQYMELRQLIESGNKTIETTEENAAAFRASLSTGVKDDFAKKAEKAKFAVRFANNLDQQASVVEGIKNARELVRWVFNDDVKIDAISPIFTADEKMIVARLTKIYKKGTASLDDVRAKVEREVRNAKKAEMLTKKFEAALAKSKDMVAIAIELKTVAQPIENITLSAQNSPYVGNDPALIGFIMGLKPNQMSKPVKGKEGVHLILVESVTKATLPENFADRKNFINSELKQNFNNFLKNAIRKSSDIKDYRYKFY
ncbi:MAG: SurA N-terminal domain-containing protein [Bacteroidia bacterium]|nr:SurA N-terminal domain-containing protein [Bacteroidia bacterium]